MKIKAMEKQIKKRLTRKHSTIARLLFVVMIFATCASSTTASKTEKLLPTALRNSYILKNKVKRLKMLNVTLMPLIESNVPTPIIPANHSSSVSSKSPSKFPSAHPSVKHSHSPSASPSYNPSYNPSYTPSYTPSYVPTSVPSVHPTGKPSVKPSSKPTSTPSVEPTLSSQPSTQPSLLPSVKPSVAPSETPTSNPSTSPSALPTIRPSSPPTLPNQLLTFKQEVLFDDCDKLDTLARIILEDVTGDMIKNRLLKSQDGTFEGLTVRLSFVKQAKITDFNISKRKTTQLLLEKVGQERRQAGARESETVEENKIMAGSQREMVTVDGKKENRVEKGYIKLGIREDRRLNGASGLHIIFDLFLNIRSTITFEDSDIQNSIMETFDTLEKQDAYILALQQKANGILEKNSFERINRVEVRIDGERVVEPDSDSSIDWMVWGSVIGVGVFIAVLMLLILMLRSNGRDIDAYRSNINIIDSKQDMSVLGGIEVESQQEVSTLGEPTLGGMGPFFHSFEKDETALSTISPGGFDYNRAYRGADGEDSVSTAPGIKSAKGTGIPLQKKDSNRSFESSSTNRNNSFRENVSLLTDDDSFEQMYVGKKDERIEVIVPAGKLGVVIDRPLSGVPMVHAIKDTSIIFDKVRIGDKLISVDGEDTTKMSAVKVSKLISSKAQNPQRVLVFLRPSLLTDR